MSRPGPGRHALILAALLAVAALLRALVVVDVPAFFGPGDPAIYYAMGRACAREGVPRVDFVHHFLTRPATVEHIEDYYEPAMGYLIAIPLRVAGERPAAARAVSLACSVLTVFLVWRRGRRLGPVVALAAAAIVAFEPWSISYGGLLMKEAIVTLLVLLFLEALGGALASTSTRTGGGLALGLAAVGACLLQYELLPILALAGAIAFARHRRAALAGYIAGLAVGAFALLVVTERLIGVPISAKAFYFLGRSMATPEAHAAHATGVAWFTRFIALNYVMKSLLATWYPVLALLSCLGVIRAAAAPGAAPAGAAGTPSRIVSDRTAAAAFAIAFLYFHGVPQDLWQRDFVPLTAVAAPFAAAALVERRSGRLPLALAALTFSLLFLSRQPLHMPLDPWRRLFWPAQAAILAASGVVYLVARLALRRTLRPAPPALATAALALALIVGAWASLPLPAVYHDAEYPDFARARARLRAACGAMRAQVEPGPVMAALPVETHLFSDFPAVRLPDPATPTAVRDVAARYHVRYLLLEPGATGDRLLAALPGTVATTAADYRLVRLTSAVAGHGSPRSGR